MRNKFVSSFVVLLVVLLAVLALSALAQEAEVITLELTEVFPVDLVTYFGDDSPAPSGLVESSEMAQISLEQWEYISCSGGGFTFDGLDLPQIMGTGQVTYLNTASASQFQMSANVGTWCTRGAVIGGSLEAVTTLSGFYTRQLFADGAPSVEVELMIVDSTDTHRWSGIVTEDHLSVFSNTGRGGFGSQAVTVADWEVVQIGEIGPRESLDERLRGDWFIYELPEFGCADRDVDVQFSCTSREQQFVHGSAVLNPQRAVRVSGDNTRFFVGVLNEQTFIVPPSETTNWWLLVNVTDNPILFRLLCPSGCDIAYFDLGVFGGWNGETLTHMVSLGMNQFHDQFGDAELTVIDNNAATSVIATPAPNCGSLPAGCVSSTAVVAVFDQFDDPEFLVYGLYNQENGLDNFEPDQIPQPNILSDGL